MMRKYSGVLRDAKSDGRCRNVVVVDETGDGLIGRGAWKLRCC